MSPDAPAIGGFADVLPTLDDTTYEALKESIAKRGVLIPLVVDQHGHLLDGHHRMRATIELGLPTPPTVRVNVIDHDDGEDVALLVNSVRRHLGIDQRREVVAGLRRRGYSLRKIAEAVGVSDGQVRKDIAAEQLRTGTQLAPERTEGRDGKSRPSTRPEPKADDVDRSRCAKCQGPGFRLVDGLCASCAPAPPSAPPKPAAEPEKRPTPIRPKAQTKEEVLAAEAAQRRRLDTARVCSGLNLIGSGMEVEGFAEQLAVTWDEAEAEAVLVKNMRWVATPDGMRRVALMLCDFADKREAALTQQEATG